MEKNEKELTNLSYESDGKMGKEQRKTESNDKSEPMDFFNITQDSE
ncbi:hypothetical protein [Bacillus sp. AK128]